MIRLAPVRFPWLPFLAAWNPVDGTTSLTPPAPLVPLKWIPWLPGNRGNRAMRGISESQFRVDWQLSQLSPVVLLLGAESQKHQYKQAWNPATYSINLNHMGMDQKFILTIFGNKHPLISILSVIISYFWLMTISENVRIFPPKLSSINPCRTSAERIFSTACATSCSCVSRTRRAWIKNS